jgi:excisionase family DNA binding protein
MVINYTPRMLLTTSEVANLLYIHINTVRRWSDQGILTPFRIGPRGDRRFVKKDVLDFRNNNGYVNSLKS